MALPNSDQILRAVIEATPDAIFVKDLEGRYVLVNEAFSRFTGLSRGDLLNTTDADHFLPEQVAIFWEHDDRVLCTACLNKLARTPLTKRAGFANFLRLCQCAIGILITWFFFFAIAEKLSREPNTFHKQTLWRVPWINRK